MIRLLDESDKSALETKIENLEDQIGNQVDELKSDIDNLNKVVVSVSLPEQIATTSDFLAKSDATLTGNSYISTGAFGGVGGFTNGHHYKLIFVPSSEGYYTIKSILSGIYRDTFVTAKHVFADVPLIVDIPSTIDFSNANKYIIFQKGSSYCESAYIYIYDVSNISDEIIDVINFESCGNPVEYQTVSIPQKTFHNSLIAENLFYGKDASFLGDSLTASGSGSQYIGYVKSGLGLSTTHNCGIGGTRVSGNGDECFWKDARINSLSLDSDCLFIMGGTNDAPYTTVSDDDFTIENHNINNFVGAYNVLISKVLYKYLRLSSGYYEDIDYSGVTQVEIEKPLFKIILITPPKRFDTVEKLKKVEKFADYVKRIGALWGLPVVDINSQMNMNIINRASYWTHQDTPDWVHFDSNAHKELANIIIGKVKSLT